MAIHPTAIVDPRAQIGQDVHIGPYAIVGSGVSLADGVIVGSHSVIKGETSIGARCRIHPHAVLGGDPQDLKYAGEKTALKIGEDNTFREFCTVNRGTVQGHGVTTIGNHNLFMAYAHVAHDCVVENHCVMANSANLAGHVLIQDRVVLGGLVGVHQRTRIGRCSMVGGGGMVAQDVPPFTIAQGDRARLYGLNIVGLRRNRFDLTTVGALKSAYRELFHHGMPLRIALEQVREGYENIPEIQELVEFIEGSTRGICRSTGTEQAQEP
jgi:UDP-N-acetylglucosamine acyltransferase